MNNLTCHPDRLHWLLPLIQADKKFHSKCRRHGKDCNMYCIDCLGDPICPYCCDPKLEPEHKSHTILQIFNTTHKKAVRDDIIKELMDSSGIQKLMNNGDYVICIESRSTNQNQNESCTTTKIGRCKTCMFRMPAPDVQFCSIHCKVKEALSRPLTSDSNFPAPSSSESRPTTSDSNFPAPSSSESRPTTSDSNFPAPSENNSPTSSNEIKPVPRQKPRKQKKPSKSPLM